MSEDSSRRFLGTLGNLMWALNYLESPRFVANRPEFALYDDYGRPEVCWTADQAATLYRLSLLDPRLELDEAYDAVWIDSLGWVEVLEDGTMLGCQHIGDPYGSLCLECNKHDLDSLSPKIKLQRKYRCSNV